MTRLCARWIAASTLALALVTGCGAVPPELRSNGSAEAGSSAEATTDPGTGETTAPGTEPATAAATETGGGGTGGGRTGGGGTGGGRTSGSGTGGGGTGGGTGGNGTQSQTNKPAVTVPQLPIGGDADDPGAVEQCVSVSFLGDEIPPDISIVPHAVSFSAPLFAVGGSECAGDTPCLSGGFTFTAQNDDTQEGTCFLAVRAIGERAADDFDDVEMFMTGRLNCPPGREVACEVFAQRLDADEQSIPLTPPTAVETSEPSTPGPATSEATETTTEATSSSEAGVTPTN